jgi:hypothetical protein
VKQELNLYTLGTSKIITKIVKILDVLCYRGDKKYIARERIWTERRMIGSNTKEATERINYIKASLIIS